MVTGKYEVKSGARYGAGGFSLHKIEFTFADGLGGSNP